MGVYFLPFKKNKTNKHSKCLKSTLENSQKSGFFKVKFPNFQRFFTKKYQNVFFICIASPWKCFHSIFKLTNKVMENCMIRNMCHLTIEVFWIQSTDICISNNIKSCTYSFGRPALYNNLFTLYF